MPRQGNDGKAIRERNGSEMHGTGHGKYYRTRSKALSSQGRRGEKRCYNVNVEERKIEPGVTEGNGPQHRGVSMFRGKISILMSIFFLFFYIPVFSRRAPFTSFGTISGKGICRCYSNAKPGLSLVLCKKVSATPSRPNSQR